MGLVCVSKPSPSACCLMVQCIWCCKGAGFETSSLPKSNRKCQNWRRFMSFVGFSPDYIAIARLFTLLVCSCSSHSSWLSFSPVTPSSSYSEASDKGPSKKGTTSLQRTPSKYHSHRTNTFCTSEKRTTSLQRTTRLAPIHCSLISSSWVGVAQSMCTQLYFELYSGQTTDSTHFQHCVSALWCQDKKK